MAGKSPRSRDEFLVEARKILTIADQNAVGHPAIAHAQAEVAKAMIMMATELRIGGEVK